MIIFVESQKIKGRKADMLKAHVGLSNAELMASELHLQLAIDDMEVRQAIDNA